MFNDDSARPSFVLYVNAINLDSLIKPEKQETVRMFTECLTNYPGFDQDRGYVLLGDPGQNNWGLSGDLIPDDRNVRQRDVRQNDDVVIR